ncbi:Coatomer subunit gamma-2 [Brachionus plicatilis]|uniref:Coatomer subunit gamma n=1 Tax=Brachionus plicatilis TaxID=10195 RepID=A0A3M7RYF7_BRAPC|nr:Coatomer subunit gamma-2 [Brachionus plicatilis]
MMGKKDSKKDDESGGSNPFRHLEKAAVLQETRTFNETPINAKKCCLILTKILYMINQGEHLAPTEATQAFFAMTKLFQSKDVMLRRMLYLCIKEMANIANDVIIVTSSLTKDMTGKEDIYRGPAIRALCRITDNTMLQSIERYMKQAIVDKSPSVSSAALVSSLHLMKQGPEVVKRWVNEVSEAVNSDNVMVQYHALGLLYQIKKNDKLAITKLVSKFSKSSLRSPFAYCFLIRVAARQLEEEKDGFDKTLFDFVESCLRHKSEMVIYEAASAIVSLRCTTSKELVSAIGVLQLLCNSPKPSLRYAAVKTLNKISISHPAAVTACNIDLENLITDQNRSIATLAITTLLKTGNESGVDRLMKQIATFMSEISDEFKIVVVEAIQSLCSKFPRKHNVMMTFLASMLREDGGFEYKKAIVNTIIVIIEENPEAREIGLSHLCEFIEDCEFLPLATRILHLLGREGPRTTTPAKYIRYIYNRVILESAEVRAAAVSALAKFGASSDDLLPSILVLLNRSKLDEDDEVRDRATFFYDILSQNDKALSSAYILNTLNVSPVSLERALLQYNQHVTEKPFDIKVVPTIEVEIHKPSGETLLPSSTKPTEKPTASRQDLYMEQLSAIPEFAHLGPLFKSSSPVELTEPETEYNVKCIKHTFTNYIVFQFDCLNTLNDQLLEDVVVKLDTADGYEIISYKQCAKLPYNTLGIAYTLVKIPDDPSQVVATFGCNMKFKVKDCDPNTGEPDNEEGYEDEYGLENVEINVSDHVQKVLKPNFGASWEEVGDANELEDTYALSMPSLEEAIKNIIQFMGLQPCERSERAPEGKNSHVLLLAGIYRGGHDVLVRAKLAFNDGGVAMQLTIRSSDSIVPQVIAQAVG